MIQVQRYLHAVVILRIGRRISCRVPSMRMNARTHPEREGDVLAGELLVHAAERVQLVLERGSVLAVEEASEELRAVGANAGPSSSDLKWVDEVLEDRVVHSGKCARARAGLLDTAAAARLAENAPLSDKDDVAVRELLLELASEPVRKQERCQQSLFLRA